LANLLLRQSLVKSQKSSLRYIISINALKPALRLTPKAGAIASQQREPSQGRPALTTETEHLGTPPAEMPAECEAYYIYQVAVDKSCGQS